MHRFGELGRGIDEAMLRTRGLGQLGARQLDIVDQTF